MWIKVTLCPNNVASLNKKLYTKNKHRIFDQNLKSRR
uniref:Uncharacterized protein n=1 Tax=Phage sp. ctR9T2 TaxID=2825795 RepID=A0A8S5UFT3_9VIRU|nr:MAG TPA: hypothetical protein [Phage sp. ctR9T2]